MESTSSEPVVPLLADALTVLMQSLIQEAQGARTASNAPGTPAAMHTLLMSQYDMKSTVAYRISLLVDQYRKGKLA